MKHACAPDNVYCLTHRAIEIAQDSPFVVLGIVLMAGALAYVIAEGISK